MNHFDKVIKYVIENEGGYVVDHAGSTNYGITLHTLQSYAKEFKKGDKDNDGDIDIYDIQKLTVEDAKEFYKKFWWEKYRYNEIDDFKVALKIMDLSVMTGPFQCHLIIQRSLNANNYKVKEDGILGDKTLLELNSINPDIFIASFKSEAAGYIRMIVEKRKGKFGRFQEGWLNRIYKEK